MHGVLLHGRTSFVNKLVTIRVDLHHRRLSIHILLLLLLLLLVGVILILWLLRSEHLWLLELPRVSIHILEIPVKLLGLLLHLGFLIGRNELFGMHIKGVGSLGHELRILITRITITIPPNHIITHWSSIRVLPKWVLEIIWTSH